MAAGKRKERRAARSDGPATAEPAGHADGRPRHPTVLLAALAVGVAVAVTIVHWPALSTRAVGFDDDKHVFQNVLVQNPGRASAWRVVSEVLEPSVGGYYKPLSILSLMWDRATANGPDDVRPFRRTSLGLHVINTILVIVLLYQLFGQPWVAALVGLLFGLHPCTVEAIPWTAERKALLSTFFALWCLVLYVRYARRRGWGFYAAALAMYLCALLSKPTATPVAALLLVLDYWPIRRLSWRAVWEKVPFLAIGAVSAVITVISQHRTLGVVSPTEQSPLRAPLVLGHNIIFYLRKVVWPGEMAPHYAYPQPFDLSNPLLLGCLIGSIVLVVALLVSWRWTRVLLTGWLFFFVAIFPAIGVVGFMQSIAADRFLYLPSVGWLMVLTWALCRLWRRRAAVGRSPVSGPRLAMVVVVAALAVAEARATRRYLAHWQDTETLARRMIALSPGVSLLRAHLALGLNAKGQTDQAIAEYTEAVRLSPTNGQAHYNLGVLLQQQGHSEEAARHYAEAIRIDPADDKSHTNLGNALLTQGKADQAAEHYRAAIKANPDCVEAHNNLAIVLKSRGALAKAIEHLQTVLRLQPDNYKTHTTLGTTLATSGKIEAAIEAYHHALRINPAFPEAHFHLGEALEKQDQPDEAEAHYREVLRLQADYLDAHLALAHLLDRQGRLEEARAHLEVAVKLRPGSSRVVYELGVMETRLGRPAKAVRAFRRVLQIDPDNLDAQINLGKAIRATGEVEEAVEAFRQAVQTDPDSAEAHFYLGLLLHDQGELDEAIREYRQTLRLDPQHSDAAEALEMAIRKTQER